MTMAFQETMGCQVFQEKRVNKDLLGLDFQAQLALKEAAEFQEPPDYQENQEDQERMAGQDLLVHVDQRVNLDGDFRVPKVHKATKEFLASRERRATSDYLVFLDEKDIQAHLDLRVSKVIWDLLDFLDWLANPVLQEKDCLDLLDYRGLLESLVLMVGKV